MRHETSGKLQGILITAPRDDACPVMQLLKEQREKKAQAAPAAAPVVEAEAPEASPAAFMIPKRQPTKQPQAELRDSREPAAAPQQATQVRLKAVCHRASAAESTDTFGRWMTHRMHTIPKDCSTNLFLLALTKLPSHQRLIRQSDLRDIKALNAINSKTLTFACGRRAMQRLMINIRSGPL